MRKLTRNAAQCVGCLKIVESRSRHDYQTHSCARVAMGVARHLWFAVDGGFDHVRRAWLNEGPDQYFVDKSEYTE